MPGRSDSREQLDSLAQVAASGVSRRQLLWRTFALTVAATLPRFTGTAFALITGSCPPQKQQPCDGTRSSWTPDCQATVANGKASSYNGCGPEAGWKKHVIPDRPLLLADFRLACNDHDCCYGRCGSVKADCDTNALAAWQLACANAHDLASKSRLNPGTVITSLNYAFCLDVAQLYYTAITGSSSVDAFNAAQKEVCDCCTCGGQQCKDYQTCCNKVCCGDDPATTGGYGNPGHACCNGVCTQLGTRDNCSACGDVCNGPCDTANGCYPECYPDSCTCLCP